MKSFDEIIKNRKDNKGQTKNSATNSLKDNSRSFDRIMAERNKEQIVSKVKSLVSNRNRIAEEYHSRYFDDKGNFVQKYRSDSGDWLNKVNRSKSNISRQENDVKYLLSKYGKYYDDEFLDNINTAVDSDANTIKDIVDFSTKDHDYWSQWEDEDAYKRDYDHQTYSQKYAKSSYEDLQKAKADIEERLRTDRRASGDELNRELYWLQNHETDAQYVDSMSIKDLENLKQKDSEKQKVLEAEKAELTRQKAKIESQANGRNVSRNTSYNNIVARIKEIDKELGKAESSVLYYDDVGAVTVDSAIKEKKYADFYNGTIKDGRVKSAYEMALKAQENIDSLSAEITELQEIQRQYNRLGTPSDAVNTEITGKLNAINTNKAVIAQFEALGYDFADIEYSKRERENRAKVAEKNKADAEYATKHPVKATLKSIATSPVSAVEFMANLVDSSVYGYSNVYDDRYTQRNQTYTGTVGQNINDVVMEKTDNEILSWLASGAYSGVTSSAQSALTTGACMLMFGAAGANVALGIMGTEAAASSYRDAVLNGSTNGEAILTATASGVAEALFEKVSLDNLLEIGKMYDVSSMSALLKSMIKNSGATFTQGLTEASEEFLTEISNQIADEVINGDHSAYNTAIAKYKKMGYSDTDAKEIASKDAINNVLTSLYGGFIGGIGSGMGASVVQGTKAGAFATLNDIRTNQYYNQAGQNIIDNNNVSQLVEQAQGLGNDKTLKGVGKLANEVSGINAEELDTKGNRRYAKQVGKLYKGVTEAQLNQIAKIQASETETNSFRELVKAELESAGVENADETADVIVKSALGGGKLTRAESNIYNSVNSRYIINKVLHSEQLATDEGSDFSQAKETYISTRDSAKFNTNKLIKDIVLSQTGYKVSDDGRTTIEDTGEEVESMVISSLDGDDISLTVKVGDKTEIVSASELKLNEDYAIIFEAINGLKNDVGIDDSSASKLFSLWEKFDGSSVDFGAAIKSGFTYGQYNMRNDFEKDDFVMKMPEAIRESIFEMGREYRQRVVDEQDLLVKGKDNTLANAKDGEFSITFAEGVSYEKLNKRQKAKVEYAQVIAQAFGFNLEIFRSPKNVLGQSIGENGSYTRKYIKRDAKTGEIIENRSNTMRLDIDAGTLNGKSLIIFTQAHELTHFIKAWSPKSFKTFADLLVEKYGENGVSVDELVKDKIEASINAGRKVLTYDEAFEEVVCDACEDFLADPNIQQTIVGFARVDERLALKIKEFLEDIIAKLEEAIEGLRGESKEAEKLRDFTVEDLDELKGYWTAGLFDARENVLNATKKDAKAEKNTTDEGDVKYEIRAEYSREISAWEKDGKPNGETFILGSTGDVLQGLGAIESDIYMLSDKINEILNVHPEMTVDEIKKIPQILENPVLVLKSRNVGRNEKGNTRLVIFGNIKAQDGRPILSVLDLRPQEKSLVIDDMQKVTSAYTKDNNPVDFIKESLVLYADKKRTTKLLRTIGFQMPIELQLSGYIGNISYKGQNVNINGEEFSKVFTENVDTADENPTIAGIDYDALSSAKNENGDELFQYRAIQHDVPEYRALLEKHSDMSPMQIDALFVTMDKAFAMIEDNLEILDYAWDENLNEDGSWDDSVDARAFNPVKPNSDTLYKYSLDFSTLCRKRLLQQVIAEELSLALDRAVTKAEGIAIRNELIKLQEEGRQIEIACALCYVESARMKSPAQIQKFLDDAGQMVREFFATKAKGDIADAEEKARKAVAKKYAKEIKEGAVSPTATYTTKKGKVKYIPLSHLSKKMADEIRAVKNKAKASYNPSKEEQKIIDIASSLPVTAFTTADGLKALAKENPVIFDAYTSFVRNATHSKGTEKDVWYRVGDANKIGDDLIAAMNKENGLRSQSWSDFQVIHLLDYVGAIIELSTKKAKMQAYTKVSDYVNLMGLTGQMINLSLIPARDFNGKLEFDSVEGIAFKAALELREKYPDTAGTISIGITNEQIKMLLDSMDIDYVIPYHHSAMSKVVRKEMHIPSWVTYQEYQNEKKITSKKDALANAKKYGVQLLKENDENYHKTPSFSEWFDLEEARQIAQLENRKPSDTKAQKKYGVMYGAYKAMQQAADNYLKLCAERGLVPKFCHEKADFTTEDNYWKLLIDRKMINQKTGELIEQKPVQPIFDEGEVLGILEREVERYEGVKEDFDYATRLVTEKFLNGEMNKDISKIAKAIGDTVTNVTKVAVLDSDTKFQHRDSTGRELSPKQIEFFKDSKVRDADGNLRMVYHGTDAEFTVFDIGRSGQNYEGSSQFGRGMYFAGGSNGAWEWSFGGKVKPYYINIKNPFYVAEKTPTELLELVGAQSNTWAAKNGEYFLGYLRSQGIDSTEFLKENGYDGIIDESATMGYPGISPRDLYQYVVFNPEQIKDINNLNPTESEDIRYQDRPYQPSPEDLGIDYKEENNKLKADVERLKEMIKLQKTLTHGALFTKTSVEKAASLIMREFDLHKGKSDLAEKLNALYTFMASSDDLTWDEIYDRASQIANWIIDSKPEKFNYKNPYASDILKDIRERGVTFNEKQKEEAAYLAGSFNTYRKMNIGNFKIVNEGGIPLTDLWEQLVNDYPGAISQETIEKGKIDTNIPSLIVELIEDMRQTESVLEQMDRTQEVRKMVEKIYDTYWNVTTLHTLADKHQKEINLLKGKHRAEMDALKEKTDTKVKNTKEHYREMLQKVRADKDSKMEAYKERVQEQNKKKVEGRNKTATKNKIKRVIKTLESLYSNPTKEKNVKKEFQDMVAKALVMADVLFNDCNAKMSANDILLGEITVRMSPKEAETLKKWKEVYKARQGYRDRLDALEASNKVNPKTHDELLDMISKCNNKLNRFAKELSDVVEAERVNRNNDVVQSAVDSLAKAYRSLKESPESYASAAYNEYVDKRLTALQDALDGVTAKTITQTQLDELYQAYKMVLTTVRTANDIFVKNKRASVVDMGEAVIAEVQKVAKITDDKSGETKAIRKFFWEELKPIYAFERIGSDTFTELYREVLRGQNIFASDVADSKRFFQEKSKKYNFNSWDFKDRKDFKLADGRTFTISLEEIMSIYAYSKRKQALKHMTDGGFVFEESELFTDNKKKGLKRFLKRERTTSEAYRLNNEVFYKIINSLTKEQKAFVDDMQDYLSTVMGAKGNEVSRVLYGIDLFKEKFYFPLISSQAFKQSPTKDAGEVSLKNWGATKPTEPNANNPIILRGFMDVWGEHVNKMSTYHGFVLPIENLNKVFNYTGYARNNKSVSVQTILTGAYGHEAANYIKNFIVDLNGGAKVQSSGGLPSQLVNKFKKTAVALSTSVVVQQPTAFARAMALVDMKYFAHLPDGVKHSEAWEELKKYAPIATIKEMGGYDMGSGRQVVEYITGTTPKGIKNKIKAFNSLSDSTYRDELFMLLASKADETTWIYIWNAVKKEIADTTTHKKGSEEFLKACGERFTEVVDYTQVYDSVLSRSGYMRNKGELAKMATSFMGEPTTSFNMMYNAVLQAKRGNISFGKASRIGIATLGSIILAGIAKSFVYALRDDDEDESYAEKYTQAFASSLVDDVIIFPNTLPYVKDVISILTGWDVERTDMTIIKDIYDAWNGLESNSKSDWRKAEDFIGAISAIFGIPAKNLMRTIREFYYIYENFVDEDTLATSDIVGAAYEGVFGEITASDMNEQLEKGNTDKAKETMQKLISEKVESGKTEKEAKSALKASVTSYWKPIYLEAYKKGDTKEMYRIRMLLASLGLYDSTADTCSNWIKSSKDNDESKRKNLFHPSK